MICKYCNKEYSMHYSHSEISEMMEAEGLCFTCAFWEIHARNFESDKDNGFVFIVKGNRYFNGGKVDKKTTRGFLGFGGADWKIKILVTGEIIETNNLWHQGDIPEYFRHRMPDNAVFLTDF